MNSDRSVRLLFGGDIAPYGRYEELMKARGGAVFGRAGDAIAQADFTICNLETPICRETGGISKSGPRIRAEPETLRALSEVGVDAVCLANNHIFDYGRDGLSQTFSSLAERQIRHVGAGLDREAAETPLRIVIRQNRISIFSFAEQEFNVSEDESAGAALLDPLRIAPLLLDERSRADAIVVCVHGGNEYFPYPRPGLRRICQFLIDMGADVVIGHHPHVPGPYEIYRGKPIVYSLGNLIFDSKRPPADWDKGYLAGVDLEFGQGGVQKIGLELIPYSQSVAQEGLVLTEGEDRDRFVARVEAMRNQLENHPNEWLAAWDGYVARRQDQTFIDLCSPVRFAGFRRMVAFKFLRNLIAPPSRRLHRLNMLRCESHREVVISVLERSSTNHSSTS